MEWWNLRGCRTRDFRTLASILAPTGYAAHTSLRLVSGPPSAAAAVAKTRHERDGPIISRFFFSRRRVTSFTFFFFIKIAFFFDSLFTLLLLLLFPPPPQTPTPSSTDRVLRGGSPTVWPQYPADPILACWQTSFRGYDDWLLRGKIISRRVIRAPFYDFSIACYCSSSLTARLDFNVCNCTCTVNQCPSSNSK